MSIWDFNEKYGGLWDFTVKRGDMISPWRVSDIVEKYIPFDFIPPFLFSVVCALYAHVSFLLDLALYFILFLVNPGD